MAVVGIDEICRVLAGDGNPPITKPRITQLAKEGMPIVGRNQYDPVRCMYWYLGKLRRAVKSRQTENEDGSRSSTEQERKRLLRFQGDQAEVEAAKARGEAMSVADHERILADLVQETKARVRAVGPRIAADLVGETSRTMIQARLEKAHDEALIALSAVVPRYTPKPPDPEPAPAAKPAKKTEKKKAKKKVG